MNKNHVYYYQVQGQLDVTERKYCIFSVWTTVDVKYVKLLKDDDFWISKMEPDLTPKKSGKRQAHTQTWSR